MKAVVMGRGRITSSSVCICIGEYRVFILDSRCASPVAGKRYINGLQHHISGYLPPLFQRILPPKNSCSCETRPEVVVTPSCHGCRSFISDLGDCRPSIENITPFNHPTIQPTCIASKGQSRNPPQRKPVTAPSQPQRKKRKKEEARPNIGTSYKSHAFFVPLTTSPRTLLQSISLSIPSSTSPQTTTLSPRIRYSPCSICELGSGSSGVRIMRSMVSSRTRFVSWSVDRSVPTSVRPSTVRMRTFSVSFNVN